MLGSRIDDLHDRADLGRGNLSNRLFPHLDQQVSAVRSDQLL